MTSPSPVFFLYLTVQWPSSMGAIVTPLTLFLGRIFSCCNILSYNPVAIAECIKSIKGPSPSVTACLNAVGHSVRSRLIAALIRSFTVRFLSLRLASSVFFTLLRNSLMIEYPGPYKMEANGEKMNICQDIVSQRTRKGSESLRYDGSE